MDIFRTRFYRLNAHLLTLIGQWPYQERKMQIIHQILFHISIMTVMLMQGIKLVEIWGDMDIMIECLTPMGVQFAACIKSINCMINRGKMIRLLESIKSDWSSITEDDEIAILTKYAEQGRKLTVLYTGFLYTTIFLYLMIPLMPRIFDKTIPLTERRPHTYLYQTQYYVDPEKYFYPILFHTYSGTLITVSVVIAADTMFTCFVQHACGILAIVGHRLENLSKGIDVSDDDKCHRKLVLCIQQHFKAVEFATLIESTYSTSYLITIGVAMCLLSISAVQLLIKIGQYEEMIRLIQFNLAQCIHLLFNSWPGQKLLDQSISFRDSVYFAEWYSLSSRSKQLLRIIMLRTVKPQRITAGKIYDMSMENYGKVMQTSASYFTVFASLR